MGEAMGRVGVNRLLMWLIVLSAAAHLALLLWVSGVVRVRSYSQIAVGLMNQAPPARALPRPRVRPPEPRAAQTVDPLRVPREPLPVPVPRQLEAPAAALGEVATETAAAAPAAALPAGDLGPPALALSRVELEAYQEMVRQRIARHKRYPPGARRRQQQGRATVEFEIGPRGGLIAARVIGSAGHESLDLAARQAVERAAPFPPPPASLGGGALKMEVVIAFELY